MPKGIYQHKKGRNNGSFKKGFMPWNKGMKGFITSGSFKKGHKVIGGFQKGHKSFLNEESCEKLRKATKDRWNKGKMKYCFKKGHPNYLIKHSKETKEKMKGKHHSFLTEFKKGYKFWLGKHRLNISGQKSHFWKGGKPKCIKCGKVISYKTRNTICFDCWNEKERGGKNSPSWRGGITPENKKIRNSIEFRLWREAVFARDNWTCQKYRIKGGKLHPHHIKNFAQYPKLRFAIDNGITLSEKAHREFHKKYHKQNNTKEQLDEFLKQ